MIDRRSKGLPEEEVAQRLRDDETASKLTNAMKQMQTATRFQSPPHRAGEIVNPALPTTCYLEDAIEVLRTSPDATLEDLDQPKLKQEIMDQLKDNNREDLSDD